MGVTGALGAAGAALAVMERAGGERSGAQRSPAAGQVLAAAAAPMPRLHEGSALAAAGVHAMIDLSDGLAGDAALVARASGVDIEIELLQLPLQGGVRGVCTELGLDPWRLAATGGEDYELLFCCPPVLRDRAQKAVAGDSGAGGAGEGAGDAGESQGEVRVTWVGRVLGAGAGAVGFVGGEGEPVEVGEGYEHRF